MNVYTCTKVKPRRIMMKKYGVLILVLGTLSIYGQKIADQKKHPIRKMKRRRAIKPKLVEEKVNFNNIIQAVKLDQFKGLAAIADQLEERQKQLNIELEQLRGVKQAVKQERNRVLKQRNTAVKTLLEHITHVDREKRGPVHVKAVIPLMKKIRTLGKKLRTAQKQFMQVNQQVNEKQKSVINLF